MASKNWSIQTRFLHLGLVITVSLQLLTSLIMSEPGEHEGFIGGIAFEIHELLGLTALVIVGAHWIWSIFCQSDGGISHLLPWSKQARQHVIADLNHLRAGDFSKLHKKGGLSGLIHGLGLLAVSVVALTGAFLPMSGEPGLFADAFMEIHEGLASLVWIYWIGHAGVALLHHASGSDVLKHMFSFGRLAKVRKDGGLSSEEHLPISK